MFYCCHKSRFQRDRCHTKFQYFFRAERGELDPYVFFSHTFILRTTYLMFKESLNLIVRYFFFHQSKKINGKSLYL